MSTALATIEKEPHVSVEVLLAEDSEALGFLGELLSEGIAKHESFRRTVASSCVDMLENVIRTGWYAEDAKAYLVQGRRYTAWIQSRFKVSPCWISQLRRLGRHFARDLVDTQQRQRLGIHPPALADAPTGIHLRNQLANVGAGSITELLRLCGILPNDHHEPSREELGKSQSSLSSPAKEEPRAIKQLRASLQQSARLCARIDLKTLDLSVKSSLETELRTIVRFYSELRSGF